MFDNWQYRLFKLMSKIICLLPYHWVLAAGRLLGKIYYRVAARQRQRALRQIEERLSLTPAESERIIRRMFTHISQSFLEILYTPALLPGKVKRHVTIENESYLSEAVAEGRGVILLTAHIGNWEWMGAALAEAGFPVASIVKPQPNDQHTRLLNEYREMAGIEVFARGTTEVVAAAKALKKGKVLGFIADQDAGPNGLFIDFLGKAASTPLGPAVFAKKFKSPVVPIFIIRQDEGGHRIIVDKPLYYSEDGSEYDGIYRLTVVMTAKIEQIIRQHPEQWLWFQKRWNTPCQNIGEAAAATENRAGERP